MQNTAVFTTFHNSFGLPLMFIGMILLIVGLIGILVVRLYLKPLPRKAAPLMFLTFAAAIIAGFYRCSEIHQSEQFGQVRPEHAYELLLSVIAAAFLPVLTIPFAAKLWLKWTGSNLTEAEKSPGMAGVSAWFTGGSLIMAFLIPLCAWRGFDCPFWAILAVTVIALLAYPVISPSTTPPSTTETKMPDLTPERERILKMLDDGKITAQESADLLNALGPASPPRPAQPALPAGPHHKLVLLGGALLLVGFFLPWFSINLGNELNRAMGRGQQTIEENFGVTFGVPPSFSTGSAHVMGGDIPHGLGWCVLLLGLAAAGLPYVAGNLDPQVRWKVTLAGLGLGSVILIYLLTDSLRFVSIGIVLGLAGYALEFIGTLRQRPALQR